MLVTQEKARDGSRSKSPPPTHRVTPQYFRLIYTVNIYTHTHLVLGRKVSPCSVHTSWSNMVQVGLFKSHYVVCTDSHSEICGGGIQNLVALVCFFSFFLFLFAFSELFIIVDLMYLLRRDSLSSSLYVFFFLFFFF